MIALDLEMRLARFPLRVAARLGAGGLDDKGRRRQIPLSRQLAPHREIDERLRRLAEVLLHHVVDHADEHLDTSRRHPLHHKPGRGLASRCADRSGHVVRGGANRASVCQPQPNSANIRLVEDA